MNGKTTSNQRGQRKPNGANRIRNGQLRRDFISLLAYIADAGEPDFAEVERIAGRHALRFDDDGNVKEVR